MGGFKFLHMQQVGSLQQEPAKVKEELFTSNIISVIRNANPSISFLKLFLINL